MEERYGIPPELVPDFIGLKGDTSDNIPGVPGIGDKTAAQLLQQFGSLEEVLANVDKISGAKRKENLVNHAEDARVSKRLATLIRDIDAGIDPLAEISREPDRSRLREVFREFELRDPLRRLEEALGSAEAAAPGRRRPTSRCGATLREGAPAEIAGLGEGDVTLGDRCARGARGRAVRADEAWRFAAYAGGDEVLVGDASAPGPVVEAAGSRGVVAHDAKAFGTAPANLVHDTMVAAYLIDPARRGYPLDELAEERGLGATIEDTAARTALLVHALAEWQRPRLAEDGLERAAARHRAAARARAASRWSALGSRSTRPASRRSPSA